MTLEEALASPTYPPAEASLALLAFLRDELPLGGTAAEARLIRLFPLLVSRIVGGLNAADGHRHEPIAHSDEFILLGMVTTGGRSP